MGRSIARGHCPGRQVAIKVLPDIFVEDPENWLASNESQLLASLNHPALRLSRVGGIRRANYLVLEWWKADAG